MISFYFERKIIEFFAKNKLKCVFCLFFAVFYAFSAPAQTRHQQYLDYIERYKTVALQHEREFGVPASITLAQGLLESSVGQSKMAVEANNHFGIKAYHWTGEVYGRCDSLKQVGYRKYGCAEDSFLDHAKFLTGPRYTILHELDVTDSRSWAQGLRDCGYAEDVNYPAKLINIIEKYELYALNGGICQNGVTVKEEESTDEGYNSSRWHHRKRRDRSRDQAEVVSETSHEGVQSNTPLRQGAVPSSADND